MSYSLSVQVAPRVAHVRFEGVLTPPDMRRACAELLACPDWAPGTSQIWDFDKVAGVQATPGAWHDLMVDSHQWLGRFGDNRSAAITSDPEIIDFLTAYADSFSETDRAFFIATSRWEAIDWLFATDTAHA